MTINKRKADVHHHSCIRNSFETGLDQLKLELAGTVLHDLLALILMVDCSAERKNKLLHCQGERSLAGEELREQKKEGNK